MKIWIKRIVNALLFGLITGLVLTSYYYYFERYIGQVGMAAFLKLVLKSLPLPALSASALFFLLSVFLSKKEESFFHFLYRFRWIIGAGLWVLLILFKLHGSSVGIYGITLGYGGDRNALGLLFGTPRPIRGDEAASLTPLMLSQYTGTSPFSYFSEVVRAVPTDVYLEYGTPVMDIAVLFRPFHWGFLFLSPEYGFSFYWYGRLIALFLVSFEMGMWITKGKKPLSVFYAILISFSGIVQWWYGTNQLMEMLIFGQAFVLLLKLLFEKHALWFRLLLGVFMALSGGAFMMSFYPAWMVPLGYIFLALLVGLILEKRKEIHWKRLILPLALFLVLFTAGMLYVFLKSADTVSAILQTEYPGKTILGSGYGWDTYLSYGRSVIDSLFGTPENPCEAAVFYSLAPLGTLLFIERLIRRKKPDMLSLALTVVTAFLFLYLVFPFPEWLAKVTLLSHAAAGRAAQVLGFSEILLLMRELSLRKDENEKPKIWHYLIIGVILLSVTGFASFRVYASVGKALVVLSIALTGLVYLGLLFYIYGKDMLGLQKLGILIPAALLLITGGLVNPVSSGLSAVYETELMQEIRLVTEEDPDGVWITDTAGYIMNDYAIMGGAKSVDCLNVYPNLELFRALDPARQYEKIYNRYAHIWIYVSDAETVFTEDIYQRRDCFAIYLNVQDLRIVNCSYILSPRDLSDYSRDGIEIVPVRRANGYIIHQVNYRE